MNMHLNLADQLREHDARESERLEWERLDAEHKADLHADWGLTERQEGVLYVAPQSRVTQGWKARRCSPEMAVIVDKLPEAFDQGERTGRRRPRGLLCRLFLWWRSL